MPEFDQLGFKITADVSGLEKATSFVTRSFKEMAGAIGVGFSVGAITTAAVQMTRAAMSMASNLMDTSEATNVSVESLQALNAVADKTGAGQRRMQQALAAVLNTQGQVINGNTKMAESYEELGISELTVRTSSPDKILELIGRRLAESTNFARDYAITMEILGTRMGPRLVQALREIGEVGLAASIEKLRDSGRLMDEELAKRLNAVEKRLQGFRNRAVVWWAEILGGFGVLGKTEEEVASDRRVDERANEIQRRQIKAARAAGRDEKFGPVTDELRIQARWELERENRKAAAETKKRDEEVAAAEVEAGKKAEFAAFRERAGKFSDQLNEQVYRQYTAYHEAQARKAEQERADADRRDEIKAGRGITVSSPEAADRLARIGGYVGGQADPYRGYWERQIRILEEIRNFQSEIAKRPKEPEAWEVIY